VNTLEIRHPGATLTPLIAMSEESQLAEALLAGTHSPQALKAEFGAADDAAIDLATIAPADLAAHQGRKVLPTTGIAAYLASGDLLTDEAIDSMEISLEREFRIEQPFFITSQRSGVSGKNLKVEHFYLDREPA